MPLSSRFPLRVPDSHFGTRKPETWRYPSGMDKNQKTIESAIGNTLARWVLMLIFAFIVGAVLLPKIIVAMAAK